MPRTLRAGESNAAEVMRALREFARRGVVGIVTNTIANLNTSAVATGYGTPIDTGYAMSNWIGGAGIAPTSPVGSKEAVTFAGRDAGLASLSQYKLEGGVPLYIVNNVDYVVILNTFGTSSQAPAGFFERALLKAIEVDVPNDLRSYERGLPR